MRFPKLLLVNFAATLVVMTCFHFSVSTLFSQSPKRVALVIGNADYSDGGKLQNPTNDADSIENALIANGFEVTKTKNRTKSEIEDDVDKVTADLEEGDLCVVFFAGHGMQVRGENYLVPIDAKITREHHVGQRCINISYVLDAMDYSDASLKVLVVDCCRDNPFRSFSRSKSGFAKLEGAPDGTIISFSTSPGETASDGSGNNSPFTKHLVKTLEGDREEGLEILQLFRLASQSVEREVGQKPYLELDATLPNYYLKKPVKTKATVKSVNETDSYRMFRLFSDEQISEKEFRLWQNINGKGASKRSAMDVAQFNCFSRLLDGSVDTVEFRESLAKLGKREMSKVDVSKFRPSEAPKKSESRALPIPDSWTSGPNETVHNYFDLSYRDKTLAANLDMAYWLSLTEKMNALQNEQGNNNPVVVQPGTPQTPTAENVAQKQLESLQQFFGMIRAEETITMQYGFGRFKPDQFARAEAAPGSVTINELMGIGYGKFILESDSKSYGAFSASIQELPYYEVKGNRHYSMMKNEALEFLVKVKDGNVIWTGTPNAFTQPLKFSKNLSRFYSRMPKGRIFGLALDLSPYKNDWPKDAPEDFKSLKGINASIAISGADLVKIEVHGFTSTVPWIKMALESQANYKNLLVSMIEDQMIVDDSTPFMKQKIKDAIKSLASSITVTHANETLTLRIPESQNKVMIGLLKQIEKELKQNEEQILKLVKEGMEQQSAATNNAGE